jgi:hypothetical protein
LICPHPRKLRRPGTSYLKSESAQSSKRRSVSELVRNSTSQSVSSRERSSEMGSGGRGREPRSQRAAQGKKEGQFFMGVSGGVDVQIPFIESFLKPHVTWSSSRCPKLSLGGMIRGGKLDFWGGPFSAKKWPFTGADCDMCPRTNKGHSQREQSSPLCNRHPATWAPLALCPSLGTSWLLEPWEHPGNHHRCN